MWHIQTILYWDVKEKFKYVEIKCQLDATEVFFIAGLIACSTCFGHHYAHHQELKSIIYDGCCLWYFVLWFSSCWCGVELRVVCPVCRMRNRKIWSKKWYLKRNIYQAMLICWMNCWEQMCLEMMPLWCRQVNGGNCGIPRVKCAVLCVKDD